MQTRLVVFSTYINIRIFTNQRLNYTFMTTFGCMDEIGITSSILQTEVEETYSYRRLWDEYKVKINFRLYTCKLVYAPADNNLNAISLYPSLQATAKAVIPSLSTELTLGDFSKIKSTASMWLLRVATNNGVHEYIPTASTEAPAESNRLMIFSSSSKRNEHSAPPCRELPGLASFDLPPFLAAHIRAVVPY